MAVEWAEGDGKQRCCKVFSEADSSGDTKRIVSLEVLPAVQLPCKRHHPNCPYLLCQNTSIYAPPWMESFSAEKTKVDSGARKQLEEGDKAERTSESGEPMAVPRLVVPIDFGSLTSLLSVRMCEYASDAGIVGVACLWASFVEEIAWHWENKVPLPRVKAQTTIGFTRFILTQSMRG